MSSTDQLARDEPLQLERRREAARQGGPRLEGAGVWMVIPCYRVTAHVLQVIEKALGTQ